MLDRCASDSVTSIEGFAVTEVVKVRRTTLDEIASHSGIRSIDYLKIDTQGTELEILLGGERILRSTFLIRSEVEFVELYENQPLFDDMVRELSSRGFRLIDVHSLYSIGGGHSKRVWGEAIFARRDMERGQLLRVGLILIDMGYWLDGLWMLRDAGVDEATIGRVRSTFGIPRKHVARTLRNLAGFLRGKNATRSPQNLVRFFAGTLLPGSDR